MGSAIALGAPEPGGERICLIPRYARSEGLFRSIPLDVAGFINGSRITLIIEESEDLKTWITPKPNPRRRPPAE